MGRQIRFYLDNEKQKELLDYIYDRDLIILNSKNKIIKYYDKNNRKYNFNKDMRIYLYKKEWGNLFIYYCKNDKINEIEVNYKDFEKYKKYDCLDDLKSPIIEFWFTRVYNDKRITEGRLWYEKTYYAGQGNLMYKNEEVNKEYNHLASWIRKNVPKRDYIITDRYVYKEYVSDDLWEKVVNEGYKLI